MAGAEAEAECAKKKVGFSKISRCVICGYVPKFQGSKYRVGDVFWSNMSRFARKTQKLEQMQKKKKQILPDHFLDPSRIMDSTRIMDFGKKKKKNKFFLSQKKKKKKKKKKFGKKSIVTLECPRCRNVFSPNT